MHFIIIGLVLLGGHMTNACYQHCSATFNHKIQLLTGLTDSAILTQRSCHWWIECGSQGVKDPTETMLPLANVCSKVQFRRAMAEQMVCLEENRPSCDSTSLQYVNTILGFIRPDYERTCAQSMSAADNTTTTPTRHLKMRCGAQAQSCYVTFNQTYHPAINTAFKNWTVVCESLDDYTVCVEDLMPECGKHLSHAIDSIRSMQQQYTADCSATSSPLAHTECVNDTLDCYIDFNTTYQHARSQYLMAEMCSAMDNYTQCINKVHTRQECHRYTQQALAGIYTLKNQNAVYCGTDGGQQAQSCLVEFQKCYTYFNATYFPAVHMGNMNGICRSVAHYSYCVQPLFEDCGRHMAQALASVRVLKEQFSLQCDPEFQRLASCQPLGACLTVFASTYSNNNAAAASAPGFCANLADFFPCVEESLAKCSIPPEDTSADFSQLGSLLGAFCEHLLGNSVLNTCPEFKTCIDGIILVSSPDPSAMFDASTWCSYMDMSLSCVQRAVNTPSCGLGGDDTIAGHLIQQRDLKRNICKLSSVPPIDTEEPNTVPGDHGHSHGHGHGSGHGEGSDAWVTRAGVMSLVCLTVLSLAVHRLF